MNRNQRRMQTMPTKDDHEWILPLKKPTPDHVIDAMRHGLDIGLGKSYANLTLNQLHDTNVIPKRIPITVYGVPIYIPIKSLVPTKIIRSNNATIVFWSDDTKTVVKRSQNTPDDPYNAFCAALGIKLYGTNSALKRAIREAGGLPDAQDREAGGLPDATKEATP
jgi:hypothetical protein